MKSTNTSPHLIIEVRQAEASPSQAFNWWALGPSLITLLIAAIGWSIVERFARQRERRVEIKAMVGSFVEAVQQIAQDAVRYYQLDGANAQALVLSQTLKSGINTLASVIEALKASGVELDPGDSSLKVFRQVVTGGLFDTLTRAALLPGAPIFELIANSSASLARKMQLAHFKSMTLKTGRLIDSGRK